LCDAAPVQVKNTINDVTLRLPFLNAGVDVTTTFDGAVYQQSTRDSNVTFVCIQRGAKKRKSKRRHYMLACNFAECQMIFRNLFTASFRNLQ